ncbi:MAG TPA: amidohydrolase family protein [Clostridiaceae bacterium]|nr:amidohydrolase family protein [Clostridiaceae bacterium]
MLEFFDSSCFFGRRSVVNPGSYWTVEELVENMNHFGIKKALVYHSIAKEYNPCIGNRMLMEDISKYPCLYPMWVVMPHHTGEFPEPDELLKQLRQNNVKAVKIFPSIKDHFYSISNWVCGELFSMLEKSGIPLFVGLDQLTWNEIYELCTGFPKLNIVLTDLNYRADRNLYPLLQKFDNLCIETYGYKQHHGIEEICKKFGAGRFIFGSGTPVSSLASAITMINFARISDEEKRMIAYGNLEKLLGGVKYE